MGAMRVTTVVWGLVLGGWMVVAGCEGPGEVVDAGLPALGRPADATAGVRVGVVVAAGPDARVVPSAGSPFAAAEGVMLVRDDRLSTGAGAGSHVVVALHNGYLVRFGEGVDIAVEKIAVFDRGPAEESLAQQFERALQPGEDTPQLRGAVSRVAGWNSRRTAAETIGPLAKEPVKEVPTESKKEKSAPLMDAPVSGQPNRPADPVPETEPDVDTPGRGASDTKKAPPSKPPSKPLDDSNGAGDTTDNDGKTSTSKPDAQPQADPKPKVAVDLPDRVTFKPSGGTATTIPLPAALAVGRKALAQCAGPGATITARVEGGVIVAITVVGGLAATCDEGRGRGVKLADGVLEMRVK